MPANPQSITTYKLSEKDVEEFCQLISEIGHDKSHPLSSLSQNIHKSYLNYLKITLSLEPNLSISNYISLIAIKKVADYCINKKELFNAIIYDIENQGILLNLIHFEEMPLEFIQRMKSNYNDRLWIGCQKQSFFCEIKTGFSNLSLLVDEEAECIKRIAKCKDNIRFLKANDNEFTLNDKVDQIAYEYRALASLYNELGIKTASSRKYEAALIYFMLAIKQLKKVDLSALYAFSLDDKEKIYENYLLVHNAYAEYMLSKSELSKVKDIYTRAIEKTEIVPDNLRSNRYYLFLNHINLMLAMVCVKIGKNNLRFGNYNSAKEMLAQTSKAIEKVQPEHLSYGRDFIVKLAVEYNNIGHILNDEDYTKDIVLEILLMAVTDVERWSSRFPGLVSPNYLYINQLNLPAVHFLYAKNYFKQRKFLEAKESCCFAFKVTQKLYFEQKDKSEYLKFRSNVIISFVAIIFELYKEGLIAEAIESALYIIDVLKNDECLIKMYAVEFAQCYQILSIFYLDSLEGFIHENNFHEAEKYLVLAAEAFEKSSFIDLSSGDEEARKMALYAFKISNYCCSHGDYKKAIKYARISADETYKIDKKCITNDDKNILFNAYRSLAMANVGIGSDLCHVKNYNEALEKFDVAKSMLALIEGMFRTNDDVEFFNSIQSREDITEKFISENSSKNQQKKDNILIDVTNTYNNQRLFNKVFINEKNSVIEAVNTDNEPENQINPNSSKQNAI